MSYPGSYLNVTCFCFLRGFIINKKKGIRNESKKQAQTLLAG